jgi:hypothetical protein
VQEQSVDVRGDLAHQGSDGEEALRAAGGAQYLLGFGHQPTMNQRALATMKMWNPLTLGQLGGKGSWRCFSVFFLFFFSFNELLLYSIPNNKENIASFVCY